MGSWKALRRWGLLVSNKISFVIGDGQRFNFWKDRWCGDSPLNIAFPSLFAFACAKEAWVRDSWSEKQGRGC